MHRPPPYDGRPPPYPYGGEYYPERRRGGNCCCRCICCFCCFLFFFILVLGALAAYIFLYFDPKMPTYEFESLDVKEFGYLPDSSVNVDLTLTLKADNPNKHIGLIYEEASSINVTYSDSTICSGKFPSFHQGHRNITMVPIELKGKNQFASGINESLKDDERHGKIPLKVVAKVPFRIVLGDVKVEAFTVYANVTLTVHDLKPGKKPDIEEGKYTYRLDY